MLIIMFFLLLGLSIWILIGLLLWHWGHRTPGKEIRRRVQKRVYTTREPVEVVLELVPPIDVKTVGEHDVVLAIDNSGSMGSAPGSPLREAVRAAENFVAQVPETVHVGLVVFDHNAYLKCRITKNKSKVRRALASIPSGGGTAIHFALDTASEALAKGREGIKKTLILLSDGQSNHEKAIDAASSLRVRHPQVQVVTLGFGSYVDEQTLISLADENCYQHIEDEQSLNHLFQFLAQAVSGRFPLGGLLTEKVHAPAPFDLMQTGGLYPVGVERAKDDSDVTRIMWSFAFMEKKPVGEKVTKVSYLVAPRCAGWHRIAPKGSSVIWRMPEGDERQMAAAAGPRILVLPWWAVFLKFILNPLFWIIFSGGKRCAVGARFPEPRLEVKPLPTPTLPELGAPPLVTPPIPSLKPAVIVGLGVSGKRVLCLLKERVRTSGVSSYGVGLVYLEMARKSAAPKVQEGKSLLEENEILDLRQDFRPYLESLRGSHSTPGRCWIPWRSWLSEIAPHHSLRGIVADRRMARLAVLNCAKKVENRLIPAVEEVHKNDGMVFIVGSADEPEFSGMLSEVAHISAGAGLGVNAVICLDPQGEVDLPARGALARELERISLLAGLDVLSDRSKPPVAAKHLFNRFLLMEQGTAGPRDGVLSGATEMIWALLAYNEVADSMPVVSRDTAGRASCQIVAASGLEYPARAIWDWVSTRTLATVINGQWLGVEPDSEGESFVLMEPKEIHVTALRAGFWKPKDIQRRLPLSLVVAPQVLENDSPEAAAVIFHDQLSGNVPYHEQKEICSRERISFMHYLEGWCWWALEKMRQEEKFELPYLWTAGRLISEDIKAIIQIMRKVYGQVELVDTANMVGGLFGEYLRAFEQLDQQLNKWMVALVGSDALPGLDYGAYQGPPLCHTIETQRSEADEGLRPPSESAAQMLEQSYQQWFREYGQRFTGRQAFRIEASIPRWTFNVTLDLGEAPIKDPGEVDPALERQLSKYRDIVYQWPLEEWFAELGGEGHTSTFAVGRHCQAAYPGAASVVVNDQDALVAAAFQARQQQLVSSLAGPAGDTALDLPYVWPEEANAQRIAAKIRNLLQRQPLAFEPQQVNLMRDTQKLFYLFADLAEGNLQENSGQFTLHRDGGPYLVGPIDKTLRGLEALEQTFILALSLGCSEDGRVIPDRNNPWLVTAEQAVGMVESQPAAAEAIASNRWPKWRELITGLALEHGAQTNVQPSC